VTPEPTPRDPGSSSEPSSGGAGTAAPAHVVVIGGGISGLAAAWYLVSAHPEVGVTVLESSADVGGKLAVSDVAGIPVDEGAESFVASRPEAVRLARDVGLETELVAPLEFRGSVFSRGKARPLPRGQVMGIPTDLRALAASDVISLPGLLRVPLDRALPATEIADDISVGELVGARLGREVVDRLVEPLLGGVYAGRADNLSMAATMPALFREARDERSLIAAARRTAGGGMEAAGARRGVPFRGIVGGVGRVPVAMAAALVGNGVQLRTRTTARALRPSGDGWEVEIGPATAPALLHADAVIIATPPAAAARLLTGPAPAAAMELSEIESASVGIVTLALPADQVNVPLKGSGVLVPPVEGRVVKAVTFLDRKWEWIQRAADEAGVRLMRVSIGRHGESDVLARSDEEVVALARIDLDAMLGLRAVPVDSRVTRWGGALPQYAVGHRTRVDRTMHGLRDLRTVALCGAAYEGVGVAACVSTSYEAAGRVARGLELRAGKAHG
jgi:oxygen-dependent protoporphyrinogen oxidase